VRAPADGVVSFAGTVAGVGVVVVTHSAGLRSTFQPVVLAPSVTVGSSVRRGEPVAILTDGVGHCQPASCLHWGVLRGETYLNPLSFVAGRVVLLPLT
jgi:murein DD-endopeptidase MepM/ murein hydrolase activator NlpD